MKPAFVGTPSLPATELARQLKCDLLKPRHRWLWNAGLQGVKVVLQSLRQLCADAWGRCGICQACIPGEAWGCLQNW